MCFPDPNPLSAIRKRNLRAWKFSFGGCVAAASREKRQLTLLDDLKTQKMKRTFLGRCLSLCTLGGPLKMNQNGFLFRVIEEEHSGDPRLL